MSPDALPDKLQQVTVHGPNIASTLYAVTAGGAPCDGLLFGETVTTTTQYLRDDDDMATVVESRAAISSVLCCATTCSFYDETGDILESRLEELAQRHPGRLLGWISYRPSAASTPLRPSMREGAVTSGLLQRQLERHGARQSALLLLVSSSADHNGATVTWQYRCFQARRANPSGELLWDPVELHTLNLAGHIGHAAYGDLGVTSTATTASTTSVGSQGSQPGGPAAAAAAVRAPDPALEALATGARHQVAALTQHCEALLSELHGLCSQALAGEEAVAALRLRRDALLAQLAQRSQ